MSSKHPIDALFEKELKEHRTEASDQVWQKVAAATQTKSSKKGGAYLLRAASVALLVGISSLIYFNRNASELSVTDPIDVMQPIADNPESKPKAKKAQDPKPAISEPKATNSVKKQKPNTKVNKKSSARVIPVLQQTVADPVLALNDFDAVDYAWDLEDTEIIDDPNVLRIRVQMPELKGDYSKPQEAKGDIGERVWAYASNQFKRVQAGESLELPKAEDARLEIPLPDFINRRFYK